MYSKKIDRKRKIFLAIRATIPVVLLAALLVIVIFTEKKSLYYDLFILFLGLFASVYFIFFMMSNSFKENILDPISGAFNRDYFIQFLPKQKSGFVVLLSIDNIKNITDRYGIENGDSVLREFAKIIDRYFSHYFHTPIALARLKAGDFLLHIPSEDEECIKKSVERFLQRYDNTFVHNIEIKLLASYRALQQDIHSLIDELYTDIHYCKENCNNTNNKKRVHYQDALIVQILQKRRLSLLFQPIYHIKTQKFTMAEVLVKLVADDGTLLHPSQFIPVVNRLGLENSFDIAFVQTLLETIQEYDLPKDILYSFNISPYSLRNRKFSQKFFELFKKSTLQSNRIVIELYEHNVYKDVELYRHIVDEYKERGFALAFDNFGSFNAAMEYIKVIDVDFVSFDKSFTKNIGNTRYRALLRLWIDALHVIGTRTILKFVEDERLKEEAERIGVDYIAGFGLAKPMMAQEFKNFCSR